MGIRDWFRGAPVADDREVVAEIEFHIDHATAENLGKGMSTAETRAEAVRRFGNPESVRRECLAVRGRSLPRPVAWAAVAALAAASFLAGTMARDRGSVPSPDPRLRSIILGRLERDPTRFIFPAPVAPVDDMLVDAASGRRAFRNWRWRNGTPEVSLDGREWYSLVSAGGVPAAELREDHRKVCGGPEGFYMDGDPAELILENPRCVGPSVEVLLHRIRDGSEVRVAWLKGRYRGK